MFSRWKSHAPCSGYEIVTALRARFPICATLLCAAVSFTLAQTVLPTDEWQLVWSDEFNGPANTPPDPGKWNPDLGGGGWGNQEQEVYTDSLQNAFQDGHGNLVLRAIRDTAGNYTSARLRSGKSTAGDQADWHWKFGRIEGRMKLPSDAGIWPAFWMLGADIGSKGWPRCGEIDILENFGSKVDSASTVHGTIHGPGYAGGKSIGAPYQLPDGKTINTDFHDYAVEWSKDSIDFLVDGVRYEHRTPAALPRGGKWVFNHPFFILLNLAIEGEKTFRGGPTAATPFPQEMLVDYVRVYSRAVRSKTQ